MKQSEWSKEEINEFAKIWESKVGKKYLQKLEAARASWINASLVAETPDQALINARTARGFDLIISDIYGSIAEAKKEDEKTAKK